MNRLLTDGPRLLVVLGMVISLSVLVVLGGTLAIMASHYDTYPHTARDVWQLILVPLLCSHGCLLFVAAPVVCAWIVLEGLSDGWRILPTMFLFIVCASFVLIVFHGLVLPEGLRWPTTTDLKAVAFLVVWLLFVRLMGFRLCREGWVREE
ncbi:MAG: hypothetical protein U9N87_08205 [Planctomycetota bacterium]|nr:hypothetical protein [Planctomycetota bacterium]